jgi:hypothetical protein
MLDLLLGSLTQLSLVRQADALHATPSWLLAAECHTHRVVNVTGATPDAALATLVLKAMDQPVVLLHPQPGVLDPMAHALLFLHLARVPAPQQERSWRVTAQLQGMPAQTAVGATPDAALCHLVEQCLSPLLL